MPSGIYKITNTINNKSYVGLSKDLHIRLSTHKQQLISGIHYNSHLQAAVNKYGIDAFEFVVLCECPEHLLGTLEQQYILKYRSYDVAHGYNKTFGGEINIPTEETKQKMSEKHADFSGDKNPFFGKSHSDTVKKNVSSSHLGKTVSEITKNKISRANKGKLRTEEVKLRKSFAYSGENNPNAKLSLEDKLIICNSKQSPKVLCSLFNVSVSTIYRIRKNRIGV